MGLRFRRSVRVLPGVRLNLSKSGISTSFGIKGAHLTVSKRGVRRTVGIPGSGLNYTSYKPHRSKIVPRHDPVPDKEGADQIERASDGIVKVLLIVAIVVAIVGAMWLLNKL